MNRESKALELIKSAKKIGLVSHARMDLDAFGSVLAFQEVLLSLGKEVVIFSDEEMLPFIQDFDSGITYKPLVTYQPVNLLIITDVNSFDRLAAPEIAQEASKVKSIVIDHHATEPKVGEEAILIIEQLPAASQIIYNLFKKWNFPISKKAASFLCIGMLGDTGDRTFTNTTKEVVQIIETILEEYGQDIYERYCTAAEKDRAHKQEFYEYCLGRAKKSQKYPANVLGISRKEFEQFGFTDRIGSQVAGFLEENCENAAAFVFSEMEDGQVKASMRSNKVDLNVREITEKFGGGGHDRAAGFTSGESLDALVARFL